MADFTLNKLTGNTIGNGILDSKLHSFMELRFPLLKAQIYMNLYPSNH